jgi:hypothetical protein
MEYILPLLESSFPRFAVIINAVFEVAAKPAACKINGHAKA